MPPIIQAYNVASAIPGNPCKPISNFSPQIKTFNGIKNLIPQRGVSAVYKSIVNELASIAKIGQYYEMITADVVYDSTATYYTEKMEADKYRYARSSWKIPM